MSYRDDKPRIRRRIAVYDLRQASRTIGRAAIDFAPEGPTVGGAPGEARAIAAFRALVQDIPTDAEVPAEQVGRQYVPRILRCEPDPDAAVSYESRDGRQASRWIFTYGYEPTN